MSEPLKVEETQSVPAIERIMAMEGRELDEAVWLLSNPCTHEWLSRWSDHQLVALACRLCSKEIPYSEWTPNGHVVPSYHSSLDAIRPVVEKCVADCTWATYFERLRIVMVRSPALILKSMTISERAVLATAADQCRAVLLAYAQKESS